jgi:hypothetical protein
LIGLAYSFEQATHVRVPPQFLASTTLPSAAGATRGPASHESTRAAVPARNGRWVMPGLR